MFYVLLCVNLCPFQFCNHLDGEERAGCFALSSWCLVIAEALPRGDKVLSAVCDCDIS